MTEYVTFWYHDDLPSMEHGEEVVRCRDCKYYDDYTGCCTRRDYVAPMASTPEGFCALGERDTNNKTGDFVTHDSRTTELTTIIEALTALASAITWTVPNSTPSVESYLKDAWAAIDKLKDGCDE